MVVCSVQTFEYRFPYFPALTHGRMLGMQAFGGRFLCLLALTHGRVLGAGFRMSIPLFSGFNSWPYARYAGYRVRPLMCIVVRWDIDLMKKQ
jgi:hypothetical protein